MAVARSTQETFDYVLVADRKEAADRQTVFQLRRLSNATMLALENLNSMDVASNQIGVRTGDAKLVALRAGLAGWKNFADAEGNEIPFARDRGRKLVHGIAVDDPVSLATLDRLATLDAKELADAILGGNRLTEDDAKNS